MFFFSKLQDYLESNFLHSQMVDNKELADMIRRLERATLSDSTQSSTCDGLGLHQIDQELSK